MMTLQILDDEHTAHHEKDNKGCNIHQMHQVYL